MRLGGIFTGEKPHRLVIGQLVYEPKYHRTHIDMELDNLLPACRKLGMGTLNAACIPLPGAGENPFLACDLQLCKRRDKREKIGYLFTMDSATGATIYQIRIDVVAVLRNFGLIRVHCHENNTPEESK